MPRTPDLKLHALWRERIHRQVNSRLTIARLLVLHASAANVSPLAASFHAWKRRLRLSRYDLRRPPTRITCPIGFPPCHSARRRAPSRRTASDRGRSSQWNPTSYPDLGRSLGLPDCPSCRRSQDPFRRLAMISLPHPVRVFLHIPPTDLRKGFDALCGLVTTAFAQDPTSGHLFLFVNRRSDRLKTLYGARAGGAIWKTRLETGSFQLPAADRDAVSIEMSSTQLARDPLRHRPPDPLDSAKAVPTSEARN